MTNLEKMYLFLSYSDPEYDNFAPKFYDDFKKTKSYENYLNRIEKAKELGTKEALRVYEDKRFVINSPTTMEQYFITMARFYHLSTSSFERYYLNPLAFEGHDIRLKSIGDVLIPFDNKLVSINTIISSNGYTDEYKIKAVNNVINDYKKDAYEYISAPINKVKSSSTKYMLSRESLSLYYTKTAFFVLINVFLVTLFFVPSLKDIWSQPFSGETLNIISWWVLILIIIYDYVHVTFYSYFKMICEPYYFTKRYSLLKESDIQKMADKAGNKLKSHIELAIKNKTILVNDIKMFASITENKIDLYSLTKVKNKINTKAYKRLSVLNNFIFVIVLIAIIGYILFIIFNNRYNSGSGVI